MLCGVRQSVCVVCVREIIYVRVCAFSVCERECVLCVCCVIVRVLCSVCVSVCCVCIM